MCIDIHIYIHIYTVFYTIVFAINNVTYSNDWELNFSSTAYLTENRFK